MVGPDRSDADTHFLAEILGPALAFLRRTDESDALLTVLEADLRARGAVRLLVDVLGAQAMAHYSRSFPAALAAALEAVSLAESDGTPELASLAACVLALCSAVIGDEARCEQAAALLRDVSAPERRVLGPVGLAYLALNQGRLDDADAIYRQIVAVLADRARADPLGDGVGRDARAGRAARRGDGRVPRSSSPTAGRTCSPLHERERVTGLLADDDADRLRALRPLGRVRGRRRQPVRRGPHPARVGRAAAPGPPPRRGPHPPGPGDRAVPGRRRHGRSPIGRRPSSGPPAARSATTPPPTAC